jgi:integrase
VPVGQAREHAKRLLAQVVLGETPDQARRKQRSATLEAFLDGDYREWAAAHLKTGLAMVARIKSRFPALLKKPMGSITGLELERWRVARKNDGITSSTINRDIAALRAALAKALEWKLIEHSPAAGIKPARIDPSPKVRYLSPDESARLLKALEDRDERLRSERDSANRWRHERHLDSLPDLRAVAYPDHLTPMVLISMHTGLRRGELFSLTAADVDLQRGMLTVHGSNAKSGRTRHIPLNNEAAAVLRNWLKSNPRKSAELIFPGRTGQAFNNIKRSWGAVLAAAGIEKFRWHDLRHHFASRLVMAGVDLNTVRELLGHSDVKMTLRYAHLAPEHKAAAVAKLCAS